MPRVRLFQLLIMPTPLPKEIENWLQKTKALAEARRDEAKQVLDSIDLIRKRYA